MPSDADRRAIKRILGMRRNDPFVRCAAKNLAWVKRCEKKGDFSHSDVKHICEECRCRRTAGEGTRGDFYGLGEQTGHLGVGWCKFHENGKRGRFSAKYAVNHMKALQLLGRAKDSGEDYAIVARSEASLAEQRKEVRQGIELVKNTLEAFLKELDGKEAYEYVNGKQVPLSTRNRIQLKLNIAKALGALGVDQFKMDREQFLHVDDVLLCVDQTIALVFRFMLDKDERDRFVKEYAEIWKQVKA